MGGRSCAYANEGVLAGGGTLENAVESGIELGV